MLLKSIIDKFCRAGDRRRLGHSPRPLPARAQEVQAELLGFHQFCDHGDRKACVDSA